MAPFIFEPSWILLTYNRQEVSEHCLYFNRVNAGISPAELIWVDNGSIDSSDYISKLSDVKILNKTNKGVARGYNQGYALATGSHVVITGCDRLMPAGWLSIFRFCFEKLPNTGIISIYSKTQLQTPERFLGKQVYLDQFLLQECVPFEARILSRDLFNKIGYLREDFGLYGYEDIEWSNRAQRVTRELGLLNYTLPDLIATHLGTEGVVDYDGKDDQEYHEFKKRELLDPNKLEVFNKCVKNQFPYYNPFL